MKRKISFMLIYSSIFIFLLLGIAIAAEEEAPVATNQVETSTENEDMDNMELEEKWVWGEVAKINSRGKFLELRYLDYDTDSEKEMKVYLGQKTKFENVSSLEEINPRDMASIDYVINNEGKAIASNISIEKMEEVEAIIEEPPAAEEPQENTEEEQVPPPQTKP